MTIVGDILRNAKELLADPNRWTLGGFMHSSVTAEGIGCHYSDSEARRFCALDAVYYVGTIGVSAPEPRALSYDHPATTAAAGYLLHEAYVLGHHGWTGLNDMGHAEVLAAYDRAIKRERERLPTVPLDDVPSREVWLAGDGVSNAT